MPTKKQDPLRIDGVGPVFFSRTLNPQWKVLLLDLVQRLLQTSNVAL